MCRKELLFYYATSGSNMMAIDPLPSRPALKDHGQPNAFGFASWAIDP